MVYACWEYYKSTYYGDAIAEADFPRLIRRAGEQLDHLTRGRAEAYHKSNPEPVANAACAVAEVLQQGERSNVQRGGVVQSESNDGFSVSYGVSDSSTAAGQAALHQRIFSTAAQYLARTGLLYRGVMSC